MAEAFLISQTKLLQQNSAQRPHPTTPGSVETHFTLALVDFCLAMLNRNEFLYVD
jgi:hypothetical protein